MPLPSATARTHIHNRQVICNGYRRDDGLWDIEGRITDTKTYDFTMDERGPVKAGEPVHDMWIRLTVDDNLTVQAITAVTDSSPYPAVCPHIAAAYQKVVGLTIGKGWTRALKERLAGIEGCTHLSELLGPIATTAFQTVVSYRNRMERERRKAEGKGAVREHFPLLNTCHAFRADGPIVAKYAPHLAAPATSKDKETQ